MKAPTIPALRGLWAALNVAEATPAGGDFTVGQLRDVSEAIAWLECETPAGLRQKLTYRERHGG